MVNGTSTLNLKHNSGNGLVLRLRDISSYFFSKTGYCKVTFVKNIHGMSEWFFDVYTTGRGVSVQQMVWQTHLDQGAKRAAPPGSPGAPEVPDPIYNSYYKVLYCMILSLPGTHSSLHLYSHSQLRIQGHFGFVKAGQRGFFRAIFLDLFLRIFVRAFLNVD